MQVLIQLKDLVGLDKAYVIAIEKMGYTHNDIVTGMNRSPKDMEKVMGTSAGPSHELH